MKKGILCCGHVRAVITRTYSLSELIEYMNIELESLCYHCIVGMI
jgi:hypothetical protein